MKTETKVKHTPTPWTIKGYEIVNKDGWIASVNQDKPEDAAYIVRAVNCHEELIRLLYVCRGFTQALTQGNHEGANILHKEITEAIAKAEGL